MGHGPTADPKIPSTTTTTTTILLFSNNNNINHTLQLSKHCSNECNICIKHNYFSIDLVIVVIVVTWFNGYDISFWHFSILCPLWLKIICIYVRKYLKIMPSSFVRWGHTTVGQYIIAHWHHYGAVSKKYTLRNSPRNYGIPFWTQICI